MLQVHGSREEKKMRRHTCSASVAQHGLFPFMGSGHPHSLVKMGIGSVCGLRVLVLFVVGSVAEGVMEIGGSVKVTFGEMGSVMFPDGSVGRGMLTKVVLNDVTTGTVSVGSDDDASSSCGCGFGAAAAKAAHRKTRAMRILDVVG
jgi:hypothetical protein